MKIHFVITCLDYCMLYSTVVRYLQCCIPASYISSGISWVMIYRIRRQPNLSPSDSSAEQGKAYHLAEFTGRCQEIGVASIIKSFVC